MRRYKINRRPTGSRRGFVYTLTMPPHMAELVPGNQEFSCELTEALKPGEDPPPPPLPPWLQP